MRKAEEMMRLDHNKRSRLIGKKGEKSPVESLPSPPTLPLGQTSEAAVYHQLRDALSEYAKETNFDFGISLSQLSYAGIVKDKNELLRNEQSCKQSWDCGMPVEISYEPIFSSCYNYTQDKKDQVEEYMNYAASNDYFEVLDPEKRLDTMFMGPFTIYPVPKDKQRDPIFQKQRPNLEKVIPLISLFAQGATQFHNYMTGSELRLKETVKANVFLGVVCQFYFITLQAIDESSGEEVKCQSRVRCLVRGTGPLPIKKAIVESFRRA